MKRVGLIDNLSHIEQFTATDYFKANAAQVMQATGGNTGNVAFVFGTRMMLENPITRVGWGWTPDVVRSRVDHIVVSCANQIGKHANLASWAKAIESFGLPVTLVGLGAQADDMSSYPEIPTGTLDFLKVVEASRAEGCSTNIAVRGDYTQEVLASVDSASVPAGCPSLHISPDTALGTTILREQAPVFEKVAVAAGNPWHAGSSSLERSLVAIVDKYRGEYFLQHPESMLQFAYGEPVPEATLKRFLAVYGSEKDELGSWYRRNASVFVDVPNWMRHLSRFDTALGPRYHGVALAVQARRPGCVVTIDSRTRELCEGTGIKHIPVATALEMTPDELVEASRWDERDAKTLDETRHAKANIFVEFLTNNGLTPSAHLRSLT